MDILDLKLTKIGDDCDIIIVKFYMRECLMFEE